MFAQVGEQVGRETLVEYMRRYGFYSDPQLDYPDTQMIASGVINGKGDYVTEGFDVGRVAIGQGGLEGEVGQARCRWRRWPPRSPTAAG